MVNRCRLGFLGCCGSLLLQSTLTMGAMQRVFAGQKSAPAATATDEQSRLQTSHDLKYPGEEIKNGILELAKHYQLAVQANPESATNYVGLAEANIMLWCFGFVPRNDVLPQIIAAASAAVKLDDKLAAAHTALGVARLAEWNWAEAEAELQLAVRLESDRAQSHHWYALYLAAMGRHEEALRQSEHAVELDPSPGTQTGRGAILYFARDWPGMIDQMSATTRQSPDFAPGYDWLGMAYVQEKRFDESIATYQKAVSLSGGLAEILAGLGHAYAVAGEDVEARKVLKQLEELDKRWYVPPVQIAYVQVGLGEVDKALELLERAYREKSWELVFLQVEPWFDDIRAEPRFIELIEGINFPKRNQVAK